MFIYKYFLIISGFIHYVSGVKVSRPAGPKRVKIRGLTSRRFGGRVAGRGHGRGGDHVGGRVIGRGHGRGGGRGDGRAGGDTRRPVVDKPLTMESLLQQRLSSFEPNEEMKDWATANPAELLAEYNTAISTVEELQKVHDSFKLGVFSILCKSGQNGAVEDKCPILNPDSQAVAEMSKILKRAIEGDDEWEEDDEAEEGDDEEEGEGVEGDDEEEEDEADDE